MKESRFIELLNLYVDHQLTPQEAAELDAAMRANPSRRRTFRQYCRMQKACTVLFENERANAPASPALARALAEADRKIFGLPDLAEPARGWRSILAWGGGLAAVAAACVAAIVVLGTDPRQPAQQTQPAKNALAAHAAQPVQPAPAVDIAQASVAPRNAGSGEFAKKFRFPSVTTFAGDAKPFSAPDILDAAVIAWTKDIQLRPIRKVGEGDAAFEIGRIAKPEIGSGVLRATTGDSANAGQAHEATAIQYQR